MEGGFGEATWNQGLGTPGNQAGFNVIPAPGAIALSALPALLVDDVDAEQHQSRGRLM